MQAAWALAVGFAVIVIPFGELGSVVMAALLWAAVALRRNAWTVAAAACGIAMILPHVAAPALLAIFVFIPPMRTRLCAVAVLLALIDVLAGGPQAALSYFTTVLPAHAAAEIGSTSQYGLTWMLHGAGANDRLALAGGEASYALAVVLGVSAARGLFVRWGDAAHAALIPPAFVVFGGTFVHYTQIMIAIPAALLLYARVRGYARGALALAVLLLAFPWAWALGQPVLIVVYATASALLARELLESSARTALRVALGSVLLTGLVLLVGYRFGAGLSTHVHGLSAAHGLAQSSWAQFVRAQRSGSGIAWWVAKAPTWLGLALLTLSCAHVLVKKNFIPAVAVKQVPVAP